ncbi:MAG: hypothetical protein JNL39_12640 [Opitutaceae bacterium]|nr:hypothetical protein [Opitutaceae bacterium]
MSDFFLADDLSGALDAAAGFHRAGRQVEVALDAGAWTTRPGVVTGVTTETRNARPEEAAASVAKVIEDAGRRGARLVFKKIDSTLRGPVAAELGALLRALPDARVLFCPANPAAGRTVRGGLLQVHGMPVAETEFARDPVCPVRESDLRRLLGAAATDRVVIADAETEADLGRAVAAMDSAGRPWVAVGSGALARPVAALRPERENIAAGSPVVAPGAVLMICGSAHAANRAQAAELARLRRVPVREVSPADVAAAIQAGSSGVRQAGAASLLLGAARIEPAIALSAIVRVAAGVAAETGVRRLFVTGGETAFALCGALGLRALEYRAELEPGLALAVGDGWRLAVKPGGFGSAGTWVRAFDALRGGE